MFCFGRSVSVPSGCSSYAMKTRFQNSRKRSQRVQPGLAVRLAAAGRLAPVVVDLRVGPARARAADRPEVLRRRQRHDPLRRHADLLPEVDRDLVGAELQLRVAGVDAHPDPVPVELQPVADELGRVRDRALLEVLPEREVAEHLEEGQVVRVEADLVDVRRCGSTFCESVVSGAGRLLAAEEERHLRLHAGGRRAASSGRRRAGSATPTGGAGGPSPRRRRGSPRGSRPMCASARIVGTASAGPEEGVGRRAPYPRRDAVAQALPLPVPPAHPRGRGRRPRRASGGAWFGARHATAPAAAAPAPARGWRSPRACACRSRRPERLVTGTPLLQGRLRRPLLAASAILVDANTGQRALAAAPARAPPRRVDDEDHDRAARAAEARAERHRHRRPVGPARPARARGAARGRARPGVEALLLAAALLGERRRARARDRRRRRQVDVRPADERGGARARARRHALLDAERRGRRGQLLERLGPRRR